MVNLERLKGSGLLIEGFGELLEKWNENESPNEDPFPEHPIYEKLPSEVERFHRVIHRWPQTKIGSASNQVFLSLPPHSRTVWDIKPKGVTEYDNEIVIASQNHYHYWDVWLSLDEGDEGKLFTDLKIENDEMIDGEFEMEAPLDEFLISFAFHQWTVNGEEMPPSPIKYSLDCYHGLYALNQSVEFFYLENLEGRPCIHDWNWCVRKTI